MKSKYPSFLAYCTPDDTCFYVISPELAEKLDPYARAVTGRPCYGEDFTFEQQVMANALCSLPEYAERSADGNATPKELDCCLISSKVDLSKGMPAGPFAQVYVIEFYF